MAKRQVSEHIYNGKERSDEEMVKMKHNSKEIRK